MKLRTTDTAPELATSYLQPAAMKNVGQVTRHMRIWRIRTSLDLCIRDRLAARRLRRWAVAIAVPTLVAGICALDNIGLGLIAGTSALAVLAAAAAYAHHRLGETVFQCILDGLDSNEPAAAAAVAATLTRANMPEKPIYLAAVERLTARIERDDWAMMTDDEVAAIIGCAANQDLEFATRIGLVASRSAGRHGELRAIAPLRRALHALKQRHEDLTARYREMDRLLEDLEAQAAQLNSHNELLRPADGSPELLRVAADASRADDAERLVRPVQPACTDEIVVELTE